MDIRILELALESLQARKIALDAEIQSLQVELKLGSISKAVAVTTGKGRVRTAAQRRAHSRRMKAIWAARKAQAAVPKAAKGQHSVANKTRSAKMKAYWQKRRAARYKK